MWRRAIEKGKEGSVQEMKKKMMYRRKNKQERDDADCLGMGGG